MKTNLFIGKNQNKKIIEQIKEEVENKENILILSNDETYYNFYKKELEKNKYNIYVLNLKDSEKSNSFNPLMLPYSYYKQGKKDKSVDLITTLAKEIFKENNEVDPFWSNSAIDYFIALTLILFKEGKKEEINLGSIQAMLTLAERKVAETSVIRKYFDNLDLLDSIYMTGSSIVYAPVDTRGSIMSVTKQKLNMYCVREMLLNNLCGNEIDLNNITSNTAIFIINSDNKLLNKIGNILIDEIAVLNIPFAYYLNIDKSTYIYELENIIEKNKVCISVSNQETLEEIYGKNILNQFENKEKINCEDIVTNKEELPISKINNKKYFNFEEFMKGL